MSYRCAANIRGAEPEVLAIHCSDYRIQAGLREFLDEGLGLRARYDLLVVPGGPQCLVEFGPLPKFSWSGRRWCRALVELHALKRLVLVAHQDCGWYRRLQEYLPSPHPPRLVQEDDLRAAKRAASPWGAGLAVELFYAGWDEAGALTVEPVAG